ncbi:MAG: tRNA 2-thiouridine(34) synthase MnmA [Candidatus Krumholzibacteriales bacterium]
MEVNPGERAAVGMSGGVDSTFAAYALIREGFSVTGITLRFFSGMGDTQARREDRIVERARRICGSLGIEHQAVDAGALFDKNVVDYLVSSYGFGETPNPCVMCNQYVKFPLIARAADRTGARWIATGHYASTGRFRGIPVVAAAADRNKDQSYFLYRVSPELLERCIFPLGEGNKKEVIKAVRDMELPAGSDESQDICFLTEEGLFPFLSAILTSSSGDVLDLKGNKIGTHRGCCFYTVGQRKGFGISAPAPLYVVEIDPARNVVILGQREDLFSRLAVCRNTVIRGNLEGVELSAKIRYRHPPAPVESIDFDEGRMTVRFREPQRAITPGQSLVLYHRGMVVGGGIIMKVPEK